MLKVLAKYSARLREQDVIVKDFDINHVAWIFHNSGAWWKESSKIEKFETTDDNKLFHNVLIDKAKSSIGFKH